MRVTENALFSQLRNQIFNNSARLFKAQEQVSTQKKINRLSDDPVNGAHLLDLKGSIARSKQYISNISHANNLAEVYDTTTSQVHDLLTRAKELVTQESNEATSTSATREAARIEISNLTSELVQIANTQFEGKYIFSGYQVGTAAFNDATAMASGAAITDGTLNVTSSVIDATQMNYHDYSIQFTDAATYNVIDTNTGLAVATSQAYQSGKAIQFGGVEVKMSNGTGAPAAGTTITVTTTPPGVYNGDGRAQQIEIAQGNKIAINLTGDRVFQGVGSTDGVDLFAMMNEINTALSNGDFDTIQAKLDQLDQASEQISNERARNGTRVNLLDQISERQTSIQDSLVSLCSDIEDIDVADAATNLAKYQNLYEATLTAAGNIIQPSLLDFLK